MLILNAVRITKSFYLRRWPAFWHERGQMTVWAGLILGQIPHCMGKTPVKWLGYAQGEGEDGRYWNWLLHNNSVIEYINSTFHSDGSRVSRKLGSSSSDERFTSELALELELELEWWDERPCWRLWRFASNHLPTGSILREDGAKTIAQNAPQLLQIKS